MTANYLTKDDYVRARFIENQPITISGDGFVLSVDDRADIPGTYRAVQGIFCELLALELEAQFGDLPTEIRRLSHE